MAKFVFRLLPSCFQSFVDIEEQRLFAAKVSFVAGSKILFGNTDRVNVVAEAALPVRIVDSFITTSNQDRAALSARVGEAKSKRRR